MIAKNLKEQYADLKGFIKKDAKIFSLFSQTIRIEIVETESLFDALLKSKIGLLENNLPEFNLYFYKKFTYFAIDFTNVPYFTITNDTTDQNKIFIGAFHNRFLLYDFISVMNELYLYPACETKNYPCELYEKNKCYAPCLKNGIKNIVISDYLLINYKKISELEEKMNKESDNLNFTGEEYLKNKLNIIKKYYDYLKFFYVTKEINFQDSRITIKNGLIKKIKVKNESIKFPDYDLHFNKNEFLAIEKNQLNERWIIYDYLKGKISDDINELYKKRSRKYIEGL